MSKSAWTNGTVSSTNAVDSYHLILGTRSGLGYTWPNMVIPCAGTVSRMRGLISAAPGGGKVRHFTLHKNGIVTDLYSSFLATDTTAFNVTDSVAVAAGDYLSMRSTATAGVAAAFLRYCFQFDSTTAKQSVLAGFTTSLSRTDTQYKPLSGDTSIVGTIPKRASIVISTPGTIKSLYALLENKPGGTFLNPRRRRFTLYKNGIAQTLLTTISINATTGNDVAHSFAVAVGDYICVECEPIPDNGNDPDATAASWAVVFEADNSGQFIIPMAGEVNDMPQAATEYAQACTGLPLWTGNETDMQCLIPALNISRMQILLRDVADPIGAEGYTFVLRKNEVNAGLLEAVTGNTDSGFDSGYTIMADDDLICYQVSPVGTPLKNNAAISLNAQVLPLKPRILSTF